MANDRHERVLRQFFVEEAAGAAPPDLLARSLARTATARRSPRWYARMLNLRIARPVAGVRVAYILVILGLGLAALFAAFAAAAFRRDPVPLLGRNGAIVYWFQGNRAASVYGGTFVMNADGTGEGQRHLDAVCPVFSADGQVVAYRSGDTGDITTVANADFSSPHFVAVIPRSQFLGPDSRQALSPDGSRIAWSSASDELFVSSTVDGHTIRLVPASGDPLARSLTPVWSPDGRRIAFGRTVSANDGPDPSFYRSAIDVVDADGSNLRRLTSRLGGSTDFRIAWSPDGRSIAYTGLDDGSPIPRLTPDGFAPPDDIFVIGVDGTGDRRLTSTPGDEQQPTWSPDGTRLAWVTPVGDARLLTSVRMNGQSPVGSPVQGPESGWFAWSPDGTALLFAGRRAGGLRGDALQLIDADLRQPPTTLRDLDGDLLCPPSWQRLDP